MGESKVRVAVGGWGRNTQLGHPIPQSRQETFEKTAYESTLSKLSATVTP